MSTQYSNSNKRCHNDESIRIRMKLTYPFFVQSHWWVIMKSPKLLLYVVKFSTHTPYSSRCHSKRQGFFNLRNLRNYYKVAILLTVTTQNNMTTTILATNIWVTKTSCPHYKKINAIRFRMLMIGWRLTSKYKWRGIPSNLKSYHSDRNTRKSNTISFRLRNTE